ncbi:MAG: phosphotransferase [Rhodospirillaceae bacterium]|nr:phosphotransferase [Rhodospirillaceae bacterium]
MTDRENQIQAFLGDAGWTRAPLAGDASFRKYERLSRGGETCVLMDAPPPDEDVRPFVKIARHLSGLGYSAPAILSADAERGLLLLEDLGDDTYTRVLHGGGDEEALYELAVDVLIDLHGRPPGQAIPPGLPPYGNGRLLEEAFLCPQWILPAFTGIAASEDVRRAYGDAWLAAFPVVHAQPKTLVLRDYHVDNLLWLPDRNGIAACGLLDFQDAVTGSGAYDLMSLLEDARRDIDAEMKARMLTRYLSAFPDLDAAAFMDAFAVLAAQRHAKVIGIFTRLCLRDGKADYLVHITRVWRLLEAALQNPVLAPVQGWFHEHMPDDMRTVPPRPGERS